MTALVEHPDDCAWPVPADEPARLAALHGYGVLDLPPAADLIAAARLAAFVCGVPTAAIHLLDADRQVTVAAHGVPLQEIGRESAMCASVVTGTEVVHCADASLDPRFRDNASVTGPAAVRFYAAAPIVSPGGHAVGTVCAFDSVARELSEQQLGLLRDIAGQVLTVLEGRRAMTALAGAASSDLLTGLANRRGLEHSLAKAIARAERGLGSPSVVVLDVDGLARVNVASGHDTGDALLVGLADALQGTARAIDTVARIGSDEFVVLLEHTGGPGALAAVHRMRVALGDLGGDLLCGPVTVAMGITTYRPGDGVASLLSRADAEMYADKAARR